MVRASFHIKNFCRSSLMTWNGVELEFQKDKTTSFQLHLKNLRFRSNSTPFLLASTPTPMKTIDNFAVNSNSTVGVAHRRSIFTFRRSMLINQHKLIVARKTWQYFVDTRYTVFLSYNVCKNDRMLYCVTVCVFRRSYVPS